jgi:hypothetical protein
MGNKNETDKLRIETLFYQALELNPGEQSDFIAQECGEDIKLRHQVESLISSARGYEAFDIEGLSGLELSAKQREPRITVIEALMNILQQTGRS